MMQHVRHALMIGSAMVTALPCASLAQDARSARRNAPGAAVPMTEVSITSGGKTTSGRVDAKCGVDEKATTTNTRFYYVLMYPWFGQRVSPDQPQWRFNLSIRRGTKSDASSQFTFSFRDGRREAAIQTIAGSERMGSGTVRVERRGSGARFEVDGRTQDGVAVRATIVCDALNVGRPVGG